MQIVIVQKRTHIVHSLMNSYILYTTKIPAFQLECGHGPRENAQIVELFCYQLKLMFLLCV